MVEMEEYDLNQTIIEKILKSVSGEKSNKYKALQDLEIWLFRPGEPQSQQPYLGVEQLEYILIGDAENEITGICHLCKIVLGFFDFKKSKRSCEIALRIVHTMLFDDQFKLSQTV